MNIKKLKNKILVVAHDAGGAHVLAAYIRHRAWPRTTLRLVLGGPAVAVFRSYGLIADRVVKTKNSQDIAKILGSFFPVAQVLTATSWSSPLETVAIALAKKKGVLVSSFLDNWVNYRERFGYPRANWQKLLPNKIIVGDSKAFTLAKKFFSARYTVVQQIPNYYLKFVQAAYKKIGSVKPARRPTILFVSEPQNAALNSFGDESSAGSFEHRVLADIIDALSAFPNRFSLLIRLHPSESVDKYDYLIKKGGSKIPITISHSVKPYRDLKKSTAVFGMTSMFLVIAALCGKPVISYVPSGAVMCAIPDKFVVKLTNRAALNRWLTNWVKRGSGLVKT